MLVPEYLCVLCVLMNICAHGYRGQPWVCFGITLQNTQGTHVSGIAGMTCGDYLGSIFPPLPLQSPKQNLANISQGN